MLTREEQFIKEFETLLATERKNNSANNDVYEISGKKLKKLLKGYKRTYKQLTKIIRISDKQQEELNYKGQKVKSLLDNADQGFLSFGTDYIIDDEYSEECVKLLGDGLSGKNIADILFPGDADKNLFFRDTLENVRNEESEMIKGVMLSLLPKELLLNRRAIKIDYKVLTDQNFMLVLTNITKERILERKILKEQEILKMIVAIVREPSQFYELKDDFLTYADKKLSFINKNLTFSTNLSEIYRDIHTFKGSFAQLRMQGSVKYLHVLETTLSRLKSSKEHSNTELLQILEQSDFHAWIEKDLNIIKTILGRDFFDKQHKLTVDDTFMFNIEEKITHLLHSDNQHITTYKNILSEISKAKGVTIHKALSSYPKLCLDLAENLDKSIYAFKVSGGVDILMPLHFKPFFKSLVHVFRNAIDHGIEDIDTRLAAGKNQLGIISCHVEDHSEYIKIIIADDGIGINIEALKEKALTADIIGHDKLSTLTRQEVLGLIFHEGLSTKDDINELSGRGIGMSAVKEEIEKLSGNIEVESHEGKGTTVSLKLPIAIYGNLINIASNAQDNITIEYILSPIVNRITTYLQSDMNINLNKKASFSYTYIDNIVLKEFTSYIHISGLVEVSVSMSYDTFLLDKILEEFNNGEDIAEEELPIYRESVSMEVLNIIVGNALFNPYDKTILEITSPVMTDFDELCSNDTSEKIAHVIVDTEFGEMQILVGRF